MQKRYDAGREILKWIAIVSMTIDHIGAVLYPEYVFLRIIGRLSFPIFSYLIVLGVEDTENLGRYLGRLFLFAFISQIPFHLALGYNPFEYLNIFFTLSLGVIFIHFLQKKSFLSVLPLFAAVPLNFDYGIYGIMLIGCMYMIKKDEKMGVAFTFLLNLVFLFTVETQIFSLFALPFILLHKNEQLPSSKDAGFYP